jgi:hypothetical protein
MALARLEAWHRLEDMKGTLTQLKALETSLENAQLSLSRKLGIPRSRSDYNLPTEEPEIYRKETQARKHQVRTCEMVFVYVWNFFLFLTRGHVHL